MQLLYTLLLQLYGFEREPSRLTPIRQAMSDLASSCGKSAFDELAESYAPTVMEAACSGADKCVSVFKLMEAVFERAMKLADLLVSRNMIP